MVYVSYTMPWRIWSLCILDMTCHIFLTFVIGVTCLFAELQTNSTLFDEVGEYISAVSLGYYAVPALFALWHLGQKMQKPLDWQPFVEDLCDTFKKVATNPDSAKRMMQGLVWSEVMAFSKVVNILETDIEFPVLRKSGLQNIRKSNNSEMAVAVSTSVKQIYEQIGTGNECVTDVLDAIGCGAQRLTVPKVAEGGKEEEIDQPSFGCYSTDPAEETTESEPGEESSEALKNRVLAAERENAALNMEVQKLRASLTQAVPAVDEDEIDI